MNAFFSNSIDGREPFYLIFSIYKGKYECLKIFSRSYLFFYNLYQIGRKNVTFLLGFVIFGALWLCYQ